MGYSILNPENSFIRFDGQNTLTHCIHGEFSTCLPVYQELDIAFQFIVVTDSEAEADNLCLPGESGVEMGLVLDCAQEGFTHEFTEQPDRFRISTLQVLYNWPHGTPGMVGNVDIGQCFYIRVVLAFNNYCTNCFQRIPDPCFTSVIEYGNDENFAGFNYCNAGAIDQGETIINCDPEIYSFTNQDQVVIPYTASLVDKFGPVPTVQVWIYMDGELQNVGVVATFDAMPPTLITINMGGPASGIIILR